jgi:hypothetical protein
LKAGTPPGSRFFGNDRATEELEHPGIKKLETSSRKMLGKRNGENT